MNRRSLLGITLATGAGALAGRSEAGDATTSTPVPRVVYHLSDLDKVPFVLGNVRHHINGMGGPDKVRIAVVVHGPPLRAFRADTPNATIRADVAHLVRAGVELFACLNTMAAMQLTIAALVPGFAAADRGGVVKLAELQGQGWLYLRP